MNDTFIDLFNKPLISLYMRNTIISLATGIIGKELFFLLCSNVFCKSIKKCIANITDFAKYRVHKF